MNKGQQWIIGLAARGERLCGRRRDSQDERRRLADEFRERMAAHGITGVGDDEIEFSLEWDADPTAVLRGALIAEFAERQSIAREYLNLNDVALFMARERGESSEKAALSELMGHACIGAFDGDKPPLLLLRDDVGVDLQWINPNRERLEGEDDSPPAAQLYAGGDDGLRAMRGVPANGSTEASLGLMSGDDIVMSQVMPFCWARSGSVEVLLGKLGFDPAAMPWRSGVVASKPARTFTPYPLLDGPSQKTVMARELLELEWPAGSPDDLSAMAMATKLTNKYKYRIMSRVDGRRQQQSRLTEDDIKRALGRKT